MERGENRASFLEVVHVFGLVVRRAIFPASEKDPNPFEGQGTNDRVKFFAFARVVLNIVASPLALGEREAGKFVEGLPVKFGAGVPRINHSGFAAAFGHRSDSAKTLGVARRLITRTIRAKEAQQPRGQRRTRTGEFVEQIGLRMILEDLLDVALVILDDGVEALDQPGIHLAQATAALDDGLVGGQSLSGARQAQNLLDQFWTANVVAIVKALERAGLGLLERFEGGPFDQEVTRQAGSQIPIEQFEGLGEILLEGSAQGLDMAGAQIHGFATIFDQAPARGFLQCPD